MNKIRKALFSGLVLCTGALFMVNLASASVILAETGSPILINSGPNMGDYNWVYSVTLSQDQNFLNASSGDFTEVIDFGNYVSSIFTDSAATTGLFVASISTQLTGPGFPPPAGTDSASILNVVLKNTGTSILGSSMNGSVGDVGTLTITSTTGGAAGAFVGSFSSEAQKASDLTATFNQGFLPVPNNNPPSSVPEPMTSSLMGAGLFAAGLLGRRRRRQ